MMQVYDRAFIVRVSEIERETGPTSLNNDDLGDFENTAPGLYERMCYFVLC